MSKPRLQRLEARETPALFGGGVSVAAGLIGNSYRFVTGAQAGGAPVVEVYDAQTGKLASTFNAFDPNFTGGVNVAVGNLSNGGAIVAGAGTGGVPLVSVFDASGKAISTFHAFDQSFRGGVRVAVGDVNGDGAQDIIAAAGPGGRPQVRVFSGKDQSIIRDFVAVDPAFSSGLTVGATDLTGDGKAEIVIGADAPGMPVVVTFDGASGRQLSAFFAFDPLFPGGVRVSAAAGQIVVGAGAGGVPVVQAYDLWGNVKQNLLAGPLSFNGGVFTAAADFNADGVPEIMTGSGAGGDPAVKVFSGGAVQMLTNFTALGGTAGSGLGTFISNGTPTPDTTAPIVQITAPTSGQTFATNPSIQGTASDNVGVTVVEASVDGGEFKAATFNSSAGTFGFTPTLAVDGSANGSHTVAIRAKDAAGNVSSTASITFTLAVDVTAPTVTLTSPADGQSFVVNPSIAGTATDNVKLSKVEARVDDGQFATITFDSGTGNFNFTPSLPLDNSATGAHQVEFRATDATGNVSSVVTLRFTLEADNDAPSISITSPANGQSFDTNPSISGKASDNGQLAKIEASVDGGAFATITFDNAGAFVFSPSLALDNSAAGSHTVTFRATDAAGNVSVVSELTFTLEVDNTAPTLTITSPAGGQTFTTNPTISGLANDTVQLAAVEVSVDGAAFAPVTFTADGKFSFTTSLPLDNSANGNHTVTFRAKDAAGNVSPTAELEFTLVADSVAPTVTINSPSGGQTFFTSPSVQGEANDNVKVTKVEASIDGGAFASVTFDAGTGGFTFTPGALADGSHTIGFRATDGAGNVSTVVTLQFTLDSTLTISAGLAASSDTGTPGNNITELNTVTLTGNTRAGASVQVVGTGLTTTANANGQFSIANVPLNDGANALIVRANLGSKSSDAALTVFKNAAPTVAQNVANFSVAVNSAATVLNLPQIFSDADVNSLVQFNTSFGAIQVELFDQQVAATVANFLKYAGGTTQNGGSFIDTIFHRVTRITNDVATNDGIAVLQGGGFKYTSSPGTLTEVTTDPAILLQDILSNKAGTIAMARTGSPNSATSQFFFNVSDNTALDGTTSKDGYAVFGAVRAGQSVLNALYEVPEQNMGGVFAEVPLRNYTSTGNFPTDTTASNFEIVNSVQVLRQSSASNPDALSFSVVSNSNGSLVTPTISDGKLSLGYAAGQSGQATITIRATDRNGTSVDVTFTVTVA